jgi:hypothetical protein
MRPPWPSRGSLCSGRRARPARGTLPISRSPRHHGRAHTWSHPTHLHHTFSHDETSRPAGSRSPLRSRSRCWTQTTPRRRGPSGVPSRPGRDRHWHRASTQPLIDNARELVTLARELGYQPVELAHIIEGSVVTGRPSRRTIPCEVPAGQRITLWSGRALRGSATMLPLFASVDFGDPVDIQEPQFGAGPRIEGVGAGPRLQGRVGQQVCSDQRVSSHVAHAMSSGITVSAHDLYCTTAVPAR